MAQALGQRFVQRIQAQLVGYVAQQQGRDVLDIVHRGGLLFGLFAALCVIAIGSFVA